jgi:hypothetical protein
MVCQGDAQSLGAAEDPNGPAAAERADQGWTLALLWRFVRECKAGQLAMPAPRFCMQQFGIVPIQINQAKGITP